MVRGIVRVVSLVLLVATSMSLGTISALAQQPIGPNQQFGGVVNDSSSSAPVYVLCSGPVNFGFPLPGQSLKVVMGDLGGFTGSAATQIVATFEQDPSVPVTFTEYGVPQSIPASLKLPCFGTGSVAFVPNPTSSTATPSIVSVSFINLGL